MKNWQFLWLLCAMIVFFGPGTTAWTGLAIGLFCASFFIPE